MRRNLILACSIPILLIAALETHAASLSDAFSEGSQFGRSGNAAARGRINSGTASTTIPGFTSTAPAAGHFGGPGLGTAGAATLAECADAASRGGGSGDPACAAVTFSQTNPARRPNFTIAPNDPLLTRSRAINADPGSIAGSLAGTYSACSSQTITTPDVFDTRTCN